MAWMKQILVAADQVANAVIPGGWADETLSSRAHRMRVKGQRYWGWTATAIDAGWVLLSLGFGSRTHCLDAYMSEARRLQMPPELRGTPAAPTPIPTPAPYFPPGVDPMDR